MATNFQEFLQKKADEFGHFEQARKREDWVNALRCLYDSIARWLHESDPKHLIQISVSEDLNSYDSDFGPYGAPVMRLSLGKGEIFIKPVGRRVLGFARLAPGDQSKIEGRVDVSNGVRKAILYRLVDPSGQESWCVPDEQGRVDALDRPKFEAILQDLWS